MLYHLLREREREREWEENWIHHFSGRLVSGFSFSREKREREDTWLPPTHDLVGEQREKFAFVHEQISISERVSTLRSLPWSRHMTSCLIPPLKRPFLSTSAVAWSSRSSLETPCYEFPISQSIQTKTGFTLIISLKLALWNFPRYKNNNRSMKCRLSGFCFISLRL